MTGQAKVGRSHLDRAAVIYVRQSSLAQVREHTESTARQYGLVDHAVALGWDRDSIEVIDTGKAARERRVVYQYKFKRSQHDNRAINAMIARAEKVADGTRPMKKDRFVKIEGATKGVDWALVERAGSSLA